MKKQRYSLKRSRFAVAFGIVVIMLGLTVLAGAGALIAFSVWADGAEVDESLLPTATALPVFLDVNGQTIPYETDNYLSPDEIPENVKNAFVALEDKRFYSHSGFDTRRMASATINNLKSGSMREGASTITQQLVKNTHLTAQKTVSRKLNEIAIAQKLEKQYTKDEILSMYLSVIYFGGGAYGIKAASRLYFDKTPDALSVAESATLAGIVKNPSGYSPKNNKSAAIERRNLVISVMNKEGYLTEEETTTAMQETLTLTSGSTDDSTKFYLNRVLNEVTQLLNVTRYQLNNSGLTILTNLDSKLQKTLFNEANSSANFSSPNTDSEAIIIENATGRVLAHHSTTGYEVTRQAGSTLKPIVVYAPALEVDAISLSTPIVDELTDFGGWTPANFENVYYGETTPREGIKKSMNTVAVKIATYIGNEKMLSYGRAFGLSLSDEDNSLPLALGATVKGNTPLSVCAAYATLARGGTYITPHYVNAIVDGNQKIYSATPQEKRVISEDTAYLVTDCLVDTVQDGTAKSLSVLPFTIASKTGTVGSDDSNTDAWNSGYTSQHTVTVWHGADKLTELGGGYPTRHAKAVWESIYTDKLPEEFTLPKGIVRCDVDTYSTSKNRIVTAATEDTPLEYRKNELFKTRTLPTTENSAFSTAVPEFTVEADRNGQIQISLSTEEIYHYEITRTDIFGQNVVKILNGAEMSIDEKTVVKDRPFSLGRPVTYTVRILLKSGIILGEASKSVIPYGFNS